MSRKLTPEEIKKLELVKLRRALQQQLDECLDADNLESRPTGQQLAFLQDKDSPVTWIIAPNRTGKSCTSIRAISWWFQNKHPYVPSRPEWGDRFNILIVGRTLEFLTTELWEKKLRPLLPVGSYKPIRSGPSITAIENLENGNKIVFFSHHDARNAREKVQGFTAPIVLISEMPDDSGILSELILRTSTIPGAKFIGEFTPLVENDQIRKIVEASGTKYVFRPEDNPALIEKFGSIEGYEEWLRPLCATEAEYRARRYGEWYYRSGRVIAAYDASRHMRPMFEGYHPMHARHVAIVDPAAVGLVGVTIWAEGPGIWQCAYSAELAGDAAFNLVKDLETIYKDYNVVERRCDCNPAGFYKEALRQGINYIPIADKMDRKWETIEKANAAFAQDTILLSPESQSLADQCLQAKVSETNTNKIIASSSWHLIDCLRYFVDNMPKAVAVPRVFKSISHARKQTYMEERAARQKKQQQQMRIIQKRNERRWSRR